MHEITEATARGTLAIKTALLSALGGPYRQPGSPPPYREVDVRRGRHGAVREGIGVAKRLTHDHLNAWE
eukprot:1551146-Alexandrium_andersonii.AAC.1